MTLSLPSQVFRITRQDYAKTTEMALSGIGGLHAEGRWHSRGARVLYTSQSTSLCLLERLVHFDEWIAEQRPDRLVLTLSVPALSWTFYTAAELASADPNWKREGNRLCRRLGDAWLTSRLTCALMVPSAANEMDYNVLFNPGHPEFPLLVAANASLTAAPITPEDRIVQLAEAARRFKPT